MRPGTIAAVAVVSALLGGVAALTLARATGLVDESTETVLVETTAAGAPAVGAKATPELGRTFHPARIYERSSPGVVTIFALFEPGDDPGSHVAQGSGFVVSPEGHVLTSAHVITRSGEDGLASAGRLFVEFSDRDRVPAK